MFTLKFDVKLQAKINQPFFLSLEQQPYVSYRRPGVGKKSLAGSDKCTTCLLHPVHPATHLLREAHKQGMKASQSTILDTSTQNQVPFLPLTWEKIPLNIVGLNFQVCVLWKSNSVNLHCKYIAKFQNAIFFLTASGFYSCSITEGMIIKYMA